MDPDDPQDTSKPFHNVVVCCTSIPPDQRKEIATRTTDMGGVHKYDLTPDVTHLIVGDYNTPKYRHVAKERPDIRAMAAGWIDDARDHWTHDREFDFAALETKWKLQTFESSGGIPSAPQDDTDAPPPARQRLLCCLTGFEDADTRAMIEDKVKANGGEYTGDLSRRVTHLIAAKPEGKKFRAASNWGIYAVSIEWLNDSIERGMILQEDLYSPTMPQAERGQGAWNRDFARTSSVSVGKRLRDGQGPNPEENRRKLRKTASLKLNQQRDNLWGDILVKPPSANNQANNPQNPATLTVMDSMVSIPDAPNAPAQMPGRQSHPNAGVFSSCQFHICGFTRQRHEVVEQHLQSHGGTISASLDHLASPDAKAAAEWQFLIVPQASQPDSHPHLPDGVHIVTEFYLERCIHNKRLYHPNEHVLGQPFAQFPIPGFKDLVMCSAGFQNEQLNQVEKAVTQLGAIYSENLNSRVSLLICPSIQNVRKQKLEIATKINVPVVDAEWLWECIRTGCCVPQERYIVRGPASKPHTRNLELQNSEKQALQRSKSDPSLSRSKVSEERAAPPTTSGVDRTAFQVEENAQPTRMRQPDTTAESNYKTARSHATEPDGFDDTSAPLGEISHNAPKKSPPEQQPAKSETAAPPQRAPGRLRRFPTDGEIGDSEAGEDSEASLSRNSTAEPSAPSLEETKEAERQRKREADKQMSRRLQSLFAEGIGAQDGTAAAQSDSTGSGHANTRQPTRRKRAVFGRAISGASSASTDSHANANANSTASKGHDAEAGGDAPGGILDKMLEKTGAQAAWGAPEDDGTTPSPPPTTQIGYNDPAAAKQRKSVETRLQGLNSNPSSGGNLGDGQKVTVGTFAPAGRTTRQGGR